MSIETRITFNWGVILHGCESSTLHKEGKFDNYNFNCTIFKVIIIFLSYIFNISLVENYAWGTPILIVSNVLYKKKIN